MKIKILILSIVMILLLSLCISAQDTEYSITVPSNFSVTHKGDDLQAVADKLGISQTTLSEYFTKNGLLYLAVSKDAKTQIRLSAFNDNFSSEVGDISYLDKTGLDELVAAVGGNNNATVTQNGNRKFVVTKNTLKDSGGVYTVTQYITIANSKTYYLSCYNEGTDTSNETLAIFGDFSITEKLAETPNYKLHSALIWAGIVLFSAVAVFVIADIVKNGFKSPKNS